MSTGDIVIGIDGGGTNTRVMVSDLEGNVLSYTEKGAASIHKDIHAKRNVHEAIQEALLLSGKQPQQVRGLAAGIAGYDSESDLEWVEPLTAMEGLACPRWHMNDAVAAHCGAFVGAPGIVVIAGTGSLIFAMTDKGEYIRNYDFHQYASSAARHIAYDAVYDTLSGSANETDAEFIHVMLKHWHVDSLAELKQLARHGFDADRYERDRKFGQFAPAVTEAALQGSVLATNACNRAIREIKVGIEILADTFTEEHVAVTFIGSVVNSPYFIQELARQLTSGNNKRYTMVKPRLQPTAGAVLYAFKALNIEITETIIDNLGQHNAGVRRSAGDVLSEA